MTASLVVHAVVERLGGPGHRVPDPSGSSVAVHGQRRPLTAAPGLAQDVREQGQRGGFALDVTDEQVDQSLLQSQPRASGRPLDRAAQVGLVHRTQQVQPVLEDPGDLGVRRQVAEMVGSQRQHQGPSCGYVRRKGGEVPLSLTRVPARRDRLLGLVHDQDLPPTRLQPGQ